MHFTTRDLTMGDFHTYQLHVALQIALTCVTITCMWFGHMLWLLNGLIMATYSSSFTEVKHAEFTRILETTAEFKQEDIQLSQILLMGKIHMLPLSSETDRSYG